jgi:hypothetical protein
VAVSGLGGLNKATNGVVVGLVQLPNPVVETAADLEAQTARVCALVGKAAAAIRRWTSWCSRSIRYTDCR